jgi:hypothetical protein
VGDPKNRPPEPAVVPEAVEHLFDGDADPDRNTDATPAAEVPQNER